MCGRYVITLSWAELVLLSRAATVAGVVLELPRFNIAPFQSVPCLRLGAGGRELATVRWGFVPAWAESDGGARPINVRGETVGEKPLFRDAFRYGRCLLPASGFYEWRRTGRDREPYFFHHASGTMMMAGIWCRNRRLETETAAIVTVAANQDMAGVHDRMPLILSDDDQETWLHGGPEAAEAVISSGPEGSLIRHRVSGRVNATRNDDPALVDPIADQETFGDLFADREN